MNNRNFRITILINSLSGGGAERVSCNLANYLYEQGLVVDVIALSKNKNEFNLKKGIKKIYLINDNEKMGKIRKYLIRKKRLKEYMVSNRDIASYIVMMPATSFLLTSLKNNTQSKIIVSERNNPGSYELISRLMMRYATKKCDGLVVQTEEIGKWHSGVKNKVVIPNAVNKDIVFPKRTCVEKKIVAVGKLKKQKNYPMLIEGFSVFSEKHPDYSLEIYGQGCEEKTIKKLIHKYNLGGRVRLNGYTDKVLEHIVNAACFVMTSNYEGISNALIEAMSMGLPCVATDCDGGGARELITDAENGFLIQKNSVKDLVSALEKIVSDETVARNISRNAKDGMHKYDYDVIYGRWLDYILETVRRGER